MKIDAPLKELALADVRQHAAKLEQIGFDGVWGFETQQDPFLPMLEIALGTEKMQLGTNIAIAFARSPFSLAMTAWDLQKVSNGRFLLGLGTQVRSHIERRFSTAFDHPVACVTDYIHCLRAIWNTFQNATKPNDHGPFYQFNLINYFLIRTPSTTQISKSIWPVSTRAWHARRQSLKTVSPSTQCIRRVTCAR